ncbi:outer membrane protein assembly factor BamB family protein [Catellatospora tritici]|uniref:outer membrane protein assembly factor BamB family protein n=1 Tax=Catellatospora tritici TaxID=2851566 RepID=UPI001C2DD188|nr:PQQ-binding-like beta-propeller repeat protein [Catellatospora tritici]MBV1851520.1 hypothetical protein [Catellatospora tritici]
MPTDLIELGDEWTRPQPEPAAAPLSRQRRPVLLAAVLALAGALAASAVPVRQVTMLGEYELPGVSRSAAVVTALDDLLIAQGTDSLAAFGSGDGALRWRAPYRAAQPDATYLASSAGVLLAMEDAATTAFDRDTGARLWTVPRWIRPIGDVGVASTDTQLVLGADGIPVSGADTTAPDQAFGYDLRTGRSLWTVTGTPFAAIDPANGQVWTLTSAGEFTVRTAADERVLRTGRLEFPPGRPVDVAAFPGTIELTSVGTDGRAQTFTYDAVTLRPAELELGVQGQGYPCGRFVCGTVEESGRTGWRISVRRPGSAEVLYLLDENLNPVPVDDVFVTVAVRESGGELGGAAQTLVDQASGRKLRDLTGWSVLVERDDGNGVLLLREVGGTTQLARVSDDGLMVIGALPHRVRRCLYLDVRLVCTLDANHLGMWRIEAGTK